MRGAFNVDTISSYESQVKNNIFQVFNGVETEVEAMVFANYAMRKLKESQDPKFSRETSAAFINIWQRCSIERCTAFMEARSLTIQSIQQ